MKFRPYVTFPTGDCGFLNATVQTEEDRQHVLGLMGDAARKVAGIKEGEILSPARLRELSAKVEFFRVAVG